MKYLLAVLLSLVLCVNTGNAATTIQVPNQFVVSQHWISLATYFDINANKQSIAALYRKIVKSRLLYDLLDANGDNLAETQAKFDTANANFYIYDTNEIFLGSAEEPLYVFFPTFTVYGKSRTNKLAVAKMNFWGTTFTLLDSTSDKEFAVMTRPLFRDTNDWNVKITNKTLFDRLGINPKVFLTVVALQGDREYWRRGNSTSQQNALIPCEQISTTNETILPSDISPNQFNALLEQINLIGAQQSLILATTPDPVAVESLANELEANYLSTLSPNDLQLTNMERFTGFTNYLLKLLASDRVPVSRKQLIWYLLKLRLEAGLI